MPSLVPLTLTEGNDETVDLTVAAGEGDDILDVASLELVLKDDRCAPDGDGLILTSDNPAEILIVTHTAEEITAEAYIPGTALTDPYNRWWRLDAITTGGDRRTVMYGPVTVVDT